MNRGLIRHAPAAKACGLAIFFAAVFSLSAAEWVLSVKGEVKSPLSLSMTAIKAMPMSTASDVDKDGKTVSYEGVNLHQILHQAGVPEGEVLKGAALQLCVLVKAADGYSAVFSLAELDPMFGNKKVLLAIRSNGAELDTNSGPARLVVPEEKRHARWVRKVVELDVQRLAPEK